MSKAYLILFLLALASCQLRAQILPREGSKLNYRLVGFAFPKVRKATGYKIEIAAGDYNSADSFNRHVILSAVSDSNKIMAEVPSFGADYTWRIIYTGKKITAKNSPLYHFGTLTNRRADTGKLRLRILQQAEKYKDAYVSLDGGGVLYDMKGSPIWFLPDTNGLGGYVLDMQFTPAGTITFIYVRDIYEVNFNGDILWKAKNTGDVGGNGNKGELYHHELTKLANGHYMVLGMQLLMCRQVTLKDTSYILASYEKISNDPAYHERMSRNGYVRGRFGTLIEYDEKGNVVWSWKSSEYLLGSDFDYFKGIDSNLRFDPHENTFFFDEKNKCIYLGYKNLNRIIKIEYPGGRVLDTYGDRYKPGTAGTGGGMFCNLHNISRSQEGYLCFFNNNSCRNTDSLPTVVMLQETGSQNDPFKKIWEYTCTVEGNYPKQFNSGGNVIELPDRSLFVNMGSDYSKIFIVSREKKELWSAIPERYLETDEKWVPDKQYRANIINRKQLEQLVWNAETYLPAR